MGVRMPHEVKALSFSERRAIYTGTLRIDNAQRARAALAWREYLSFANSVVLPALGGVLGGALVLLVLWVAGGDRSSTTVFLVVFPTAWFLFSAALWPTRRDNAESMAQRAADVLADQPENPVG